ncbi:hypothetical protein F5144DRAFT_610938 [Chaetomium tenue]|uniref:Uncharacterized protein n=1 Tax=Chaetomium tenue TaxID=1854479 RepID=A0ACB7PFM1_9PEZI|nr:hypothetical protein F5144DRAFT_610938 [Chaetomium globosum]
MASEDPTEAVPHDVPLSDGLVKRIASIQLITESHGPGSVGDPSSGNWTWFEVCIVGSTESGTKERRWMSHENAFLTNSHAWREGRIFGAEHGLLKFLKESPLKVRAYAYFNWTIAVRRVFLVFNIGCETFTQDLRLGSAACSPILVAGRTVEAPTDELLKGGPGEKVSYQTVAEGKIVSVSENQPENRPENQPKIVIYKAAKLEEMKAIKEPPGIPFNRLLVVMDASAFNKPEDYRHLSWDQAVEDFWNEEADNPFHLLIRLGHEGALYKPPHSKNKKNRQVLIFDSRNPQGHFLQPYFRRKGFDEEAQRALEGNLQAAYLAGLAASLAKESEKSLEWLCETQVKEAATIALRWSRRYAAAIESARRGKESPRPPTWQSMKLETKNDPVLIPIRLEDDRNTSGSLVFRAMPYNPIKHAAWDIVRKGREAVLSLVPTARFKGLATADRNEVERFRSIAHEIQDYVDKGKTDPKPKPLSIAVFGQPGSGKSFGIEQVILSIMEECGKKDEMKTLKFDLSQFQQPSDLQTAFETIRDQSMRGKMPVVFFDEFDTTFNHEPLYWVQHLLNPIEFGEWKTKAGTKTQLGRGIFVFIGGTAKTRDEFRDPKNDKKLKGPSASCSDPEDKEDEGEADSSSVSTPPSTPGGVALDREALETFLKEQLGEENTAPGRPIDVEISGKKSYTHLVDDFYKVREQTVSGKTPLVFIHGFDTELTSSTGDGKSKTEPLGWLKYFLAPMQDGAFMDGGFSRPLGRAIFVFIGGESGHIKSFLDCQDDQNKDQNQHAADVFRRAKGPDFMSRLQGYVKPDMGSFDCLKTVIERYKDSGKAKPLSLGFFQDPEPKQPDQTPEDPQISTASKGTEADKLQSDRRSKFVAVVGDRYVDILGPDRVDEKDEMFVLRRAILLRSMLDRLPESPQSQKIKLNDKVLNALLRVPRFHHGARSLEAIISMSRLTKGSWNYYKELNLSEDEKLQLGLHVDQREFEALLKKKPLTPEDETDPILVKRRFELQQHSVKIIGVAKQTEGDVTAWVKPAQGGAGRSEKVAPEYRCPQQVIIDKGKQGL